MAYRGLYSGIDRYRSPAINWLVGAKRDAVALHALFGDTLGDGGAPLVDHQATRATIEEHFSALAECDPDDLVVAFSGHGSESHELVTHDANVADLQFPETLWRSGSRPYLRVASSAFSIVAFRQAWTRRRSKSTRFLATFRPKRVCWTNWAVRAG
jgi:hypothetical protein